MLPPVKKSISCCLSHQNPPTYLLRAVLACKRCLLCADFSPDSDEMTYSLEKTMLCIEDSYFSWKQWFEVKNILMMNLLLTNTQILASQDVNWWTGVVWITCGLLWCFYQLFGLSFWRHPFTAEDLLLSKWCNATFFQICFHAETNSSTSWVNDSFNKANDLISCWLQWSPKYVWKSRSCSF